MAYEQLFCGISAIVDKMTVDLSRGSVDADLYHLQPSPRYRQQSSTPIRVWLNKRLPENGMLGTGAVFRGAGGSDDSNIEAVMFRRMVMPNDIYCRLFDTLDDILLLMEFENVSGDTVRVAAKDTSLISGGLSIITPRREVADCAVRIVENVTFLLQGTVKTECSGS